MKPIYAIIVLLFLLSMCTLTSPDEKAIKNDLSTRFTGFEIVEIKKDSAEVDNAMNYSNSCKVIIAGNNLLISKATLRYYGIEYDENHNEYKVKPWSLDKITHYADSITDKSLEIVKRYMELQFSKSEPCNYVKYRIYDGVDKIAKEEYYQYREGADEWVHRPCDWDEWLKENGEENLFDEATATYKEFLLDIAYGRI